MSVAEICQLCENRGADRTCGQCGRLVCDRHFESETGLCADCASTAGGRGTTDDPDRPGGDDVLRF
jgi:hypothetical protein